MPLYYVFVGMMPDAIVLFFSCCRCIIFGGLPAKGKRNIQSNFAKILVLGRLGCVIVQEGSQLVQAASAGPTGFPAIFNRIWQ